VNPGNNGFQPERSLDFSMFGNQMGVQGGNFDPDPLFEETRCHEIPNILGNYCDGKFFFRTDQNRLYFKKVRRDPTQEEVGKYACLFRKVEDSNGNIAYQISNPSKGFNIDTFMASKLKEIKQEYNPRLANSGKNHDHFWVMKYSKTQIQLHRFINKGTQRFTRKCFYLNYKVEHGDKFGIFICNNRGPKGNHTNKNKKKNAGNNYKPAPKKNNNNHRPNRSNTSNGQSPKKFNNNKPSKGFYNNDNNWKRKFENKMEDKLYDMRNGIRNDIRNDLRSFMRSNEGNSGGNRPFY
jgi:hypothetical protein